MRRSLPSISPDGQIYQGSIQSTCRMRNLEGSTLGKADIDFDFGITPRLLSSSDGALLTADLTYLIARRALVQPQVNSKVAERLRETRQLLDVNINQLINSRYLDILNDAAKENLVDISRQILPNGIKLPLPDWASL